MKLQVLDLIIFLVYMAGIVVFGSTFFRKNRNAGQYTAGGGILPPWIVGMSIFATFVSSISFLAIPGKAYQSDRNAFVFSLTIPVAAILAVRFFVPLYRSINGISAYTYLEKRFGVWARTYASLCYILTQLMRVGSILYLMALPLNTLFGMPGQLIDIAVEHGKFSLGSFGASVSRSTFWVMACTACLSTSRITGSTRIIYSAT